MKSKKDYICTKPKQSKYCHVKNGKLYATVSPESLIDASKHFIERDEIMIGYNLLGEAIRLMNESKK